MKTQPHKVLFAIFLCLALALVAGKEAQTANTKTTKLIVPPYVQLGSSPQDGNLSLLFVADAQETNWKFEYKCGPNAKFQTAPLDERTLNGCPEMKSFRAVMSGLAPDSDIEYRLTADGNILSQGHTKSLPGANTPLRFAVFGDCGHGSKGEKNIALALAKAKPSMAVITGDIVYPIGTIKHYLKHFYPYFNSQAGEPGAPLMKSVLFVGCPGNHDIASGGLEDTRNLEFAPDSMGYFTLWEQPLNGPTLPPENTPQVHGSHNRINDLIQAAGHNYPRMANFSYDYGNSHWVILDGNNYVDWKNSDLKNWVDTDLANSKRLWKFVVMHQPGFSSDWHHREEQQMRYLASVFQKNHVDIVFSGHSHTYQRTCPLNFKLAERDPKHLDHEAKAGFVYGSFTLDKTFDGDKNTHPNGVIYIVTGAAGAPLSSLPQLEEDPTMLQPFTTKFICKKHSFSLCTLDNSKMSLEQIAEDGAVVDKITISK